MKTFNVGLFDSGVGGIKVLERLVKEYPFFNFVYLFDKSGLPYGDKSTVQLNDRALKAVEFLKSQRCEVIIVACNTQTVASLECLKSRAQVKVYGVLPPIQTALNDGKRKILVMATPYTVNSVNSIIINDNLKARLIFAPQPNLAQIVEYNLHKKEVVDEYVENLYRTYSTCVDSIVLGCTHYYYLKNQLETRFGVKVYDGVDNLLAEINKDVQCVGGLRGGNVRFFYS